MELRQEEHIVSRVDHRGVVGRVVEVVVAEESGRGCEVELHETCHVAMEDRGRHTWVSVGDTQRHDEDD